MSSFQPFEAEWQPYDANFIRQHVPEQPGTYLLSCPREKVIYAGKAGRSLRRRLLSYEHSHNKWIRVYWDARGEVERWTQGAASPAQLHFLFRISATAQAAAAAEAILIQQYRAALDGLNQRNEWLPLWNPRDPAYEILARKVRQSLPPEQRAAYDQWLRQNQRTDAD